MTKGISRATEDDLAEILALQYLAYQSEAELFKSKDLPPLKETLEELTEEFKKGIILKIVSDNNAIIASVRAYLKGDTVHIGKLMVHPDFRRRGLGSRLLMEIERYYPQKRYELFTSTKSINNIKLYQNLGYEIFDEKKISEELTFVYLQKQ